METTEKTILLETIGDVKDSMLELEAGSEDFKRQGDVLCKLLEQYNTIEKNEIELLKANISERSEKTECEINKAIKNKEFIIKIVENALKFAGTVGAGYFVLKVVLIILDYEKDGAITSKSLSVILKFLKLI